MKDLLKNKTTKERAEIKVAEIAKLNHVGKFTQDDIEVEILSLELTTVNEKTGVEVMAKAKQNGIPLGFGKNGDVEIERFRIWNPPIMVQDGTFTNKESRGKLIREPNYKEDLKQAIRDVLIQTIKLTGSKTGVVPGKVGHTVDTFYPDANTETTSVDGPLDTQNEATSWANMRGSSTCQRVQPSTDADWATFNGYFTPNWLMYRSMFLFDTSTIPDTDTVNSATFSVFVTARSEDYGNALSYSRLVTSTPASNTDLVTGDWDQFGTTAQSDTDIAYANLRTSIYHDFPLNATGIASISTSGITKFGLRNGGDIANSDYVTGAGDKQEGMSIRYADFSGTTNDPKLVVVHNPSGSKSIDYLIIGGGGGGGYRAGGGGGAGGMRTGSTITGVGSYTVTVGGRGAPGNSTPTHATDGGDSSFNGITATGGGGGGSSVGDSGMRPGNYGGSGGGAAHDGAKGDGISGQGNNGGLGTAGANEGGGGGGAGGAGANAADPNGGAGGAGMSSSISGSAVTYCVGGEGGDEVATGATNSNYGSGGGGGAGITAPSDGDSGQVGVIILSYPTGHIRATGGTITTSGGNTIHTFVGSGNSPATYTFTVLPPVGFFPFFLQD